MKKYKVLIPDRSIDADVEKKVFGDRYEILTPNVKQLSEIEDRVWSSVDGILVWHDFEYKKETISKLINCKGIVRVGTGYDNIDLKAAAEYGIIISNVPDYGTNDVADHTWALILALERGILLFNYKILNRGPWSWELGTNLERIQHRTIGIIGLGRIGTAVALRAKAFGMDVVFYDPYISIGIEKSLMISRVHQLKDLLKKSDIITIHPEATSDLINSIKKIKSCNKKVGVSLNPKTSINKVLPILNTIDLVLIMSVNPGFGGQKFIKETLEKVKKLRKEIDSKNLKTEIEIDGGINFENAKMAKDAGVDILVSGTTIFKENHGDLAKNIQKLRQK